MPVTMAIGGERLIGSGDVVVAIGPLPDLGAEAQLVVPASRKWRLISLTTFLTAGAPAGSRRVQLTLDDGVTIFGELTNTFSITGGTATRISWPAPGGILLNNSSASSLTVANMPAPFFLLAGFRLTTRTVALNAADQFSPLTALVEEWVV